MSSKFRPYSWSLNLCARLGISFGVEHCHNIILMYFFAGLSYLMCAFMFDRLTRIQWHYNNAVFYSKCLLLFLYQVSLWNYSNWTLMNAPCKRFDGRLRVGISSTQMAFTYGLCAIRWVHILWEFIGIHWTNQPRGNRIIPNPSFIDL